MKLRRFGALAGAFLLTFGVASSVFAHSGGDGGDKCDNNAGPQISSTDGGGHVKCVPAISIKKTADHDTLPFGGGSVTYTYVVTNTGNVSVSDVAVKDDKCKPVTAVDKSFDGNLGPTDTATFTCTTDITKTTTNIGTATANWSDCSEHDDSKPADLTALTNEGGHEGCAPKPVDPATDSATVTVASAPQDSPAISIVKTVDPTELAFGGGTVNYSYEVTNTGNVKLFDVKVTDDAGTPLDKSDDAGFKVTCPKDTLDVDESMTCTAKGIAITATTTNIGTAAADCAKDGHGDGPDLSVQSDNEDHHDCTVKASDDATVTVAPPPADAPAITIAKSVDHPFLEKKGGTATYSYVVTNTGNVKLWNIKITDDAGTPGVPGDDAAFNALIVCPATSLDVGAKMTCHSAAVTFAKNTTGSNIVTTNIASVSADTGAECADCSISSATSSATVTVGAAGTEAATDAPAGPTAPPTDAIVSTTTDAGGSLPLLLIVLGIIGLGAVVLTPGRAKR